MVYLFEAVIIVNPQLGRGCLFELGQKDILKASKFLQNPALFIRLFIIFPRNVPISNGRGEGGNEDSDVQCEQLEAAGDAVRLPTPSPQLLAGRHHLLPGFLGV